MHCSGSVLISIFGSVLISIFYTDFLTHLSVLYGLIISKGDLYF